MVVDLLPWRARVRRHDQPDQALRDSLADHYIIDRPAISQHQKSEDGTQKWLLKMTDGQEVESVHIPESDRGACAWSSQVGCTLTCRFCHTGTQRLVRNLTVAEIVSQVMLAKDALQEWHEPQPRQKAGSRRGRREDVEPVRKLTNIVMMGMGEPLYNYDNVAKALRID